MIFLGNPYCYSGVCIKYPYLGAIFLILWLLVLFIVKRTFVKFENNDEKKEYLKSNLKIRKFVIITRTIALLLLTIAMMSPFMTVTKVIPGEPSVTILADNSSSYSLFDNTIAENLKNKLSEKLPTRIRYIGYGEKSPIGDSIMNFVQNDDNILLVSDGQNNQGHALGDMINYITQLNATISNLDIDPIKSDIGVSLDGPYEVVHGSEPILRVNVQNIGKLSGYTLTVKIDGNIIISEANAKTQTFTINPSMGMHKITAEITINDYFPQNNIYYKTIKVVPKPDLLFVVNKESPLIGGLQGIYNLDVKENVPDNLDRYDAIVIDDVRESVVHGKVVEINNYITDGNGMVVIGGENSYDQGGYRDSLFETMLPIDVGSGTIVEDTTNNVVIVMDISDSGITDKYLSGKTILDISKGIAIKLIENFDKNTSLGFVVFAKFATTLAPIKKISEHTNLISRIDSLKYAQATNILSGVQKAGFMLEQESGSKNIILISDGGEYSEYRQKALKIEAVRLASFGYRIYTVGVGEGAEGEAYTNRALLEEVAILGNGQYFEPGESQYLNVLFGNPEASDDIFKGNSNLVVFDKNHFITKDLIVQSRITGINFVVPKPAARQLIVSNEKHPVLTVWRFGLGRIAAFATDDGSKWSSSLLTNENSRLITRTINWAVGDLTRKKEYDVQILDTTLGKSTDVNVLSNSIPSVEGLDFSQVEPRIYTALYVPDSQGFHEFLGVPFAVNYNDEYLKLGMNDRLDELVTISGGSTFDPNDVDSIVNAIRSFSRRVRSNTLSLRWPFVVLAIIILLGEMYARKRNENEKFIK